MSEVEYDLAAFQRAKFVGREGALMELHVHVEPEPGAALTSLARAVEAANDVLAAEEEAGREMYGLVKAVAPGPRGPVADFEECEPVEALRLYLETLARALEELGITGRLTPLPPDGRDRWYGNNTFGTLTALLQLVVDVPSVLSTWDHHAHQPAIGWHVDESATEEALGSLVTWTLAAGDRVDMWQGMTQMTAGADQVADLLREGLGRGLPVQLRASDGPTRMRSVKVNRFGDVVVHSYEPARPRPDHLGDLTALLTDAAPALRGGWVQEADTAAISRSDLLTRIPPDHPLMRRVGNTVWWLFHLEPSYVVDAFVAQVLNDEQLARTHDLSDERWHVNDLGPDRHLVVARDPEPWFDQDPLPLPQRPDYDNAWRRSPINSVDDRVLAQARADFGDAIMTLETLERHPFVGPPERRP